MYIMFLLFLIALYLGCTLFVGPAVAYVICTGFCILSVILLIGWAFSLAFQSIGMAAESSCWCAAISIVAIIALWIFLKRHHDHKKKELRRMRMKEAYALDLRREAEKKELRKMRMEKAAEVSPCDEPIFLDFKFGMNEKEVNEHFQQLKTSNRIEYYGGVYYYPWIYCPLEKEHRKTYNGSITPYFHNDSLYRIVIYFRILDRTHYSSLETDIHAALKKKGYSIFRSISPEKYYFIKQNIAVSIKENADKYYNIEVEYLDARVDKAKKLQEEEEQKKEEERRRQEEARKQAHSDF